MASSSVITKDVNTRADIRASSADDRRKDGDIKVIVGIPAYNEEVAIGSIVLRSLQYTDMVIVIDDGSKDKTAEVAKLAGASVFVHETNKGKGAGIRDIFDYAKSAGADIVVLIDGDGQHNPDDMPGLLEPIINDEADMVIGSRFITKDNHSVPIYRRVGQEVLTLATNKAAGFKVMDTQSGFRAFSKKTVDCFSFGEMGMGIESEMLVDAGKASLRVKEVQVNMRYDVNGSTYNPVTHGFSVLFSVLKVAVQNRSTRKNKTLNSMNK